MKFILFTFSILILFSCKKKTEDTGEPTTHEELVTSVKDELFAHYDFNNSSFADKSGNNRSLTGFGVKFSHDLNGNPNSAIEFDGIDDYAVIEAAKNLPEGDFTINFLMMPKRSSGSIIQKANPNNGTAASFAISFDDVKNNNQLIFNTSSSTDPCNSLSTPTTLALNRTLFNDAWYNVTVVFKDGVQKGYINAYHIFTVNAPNKSLKHCTNSPIYLGIAALNNLQPFMGKLDNLRIYTRALSDKEIEHIYWSYK